MRVTEPSALWLLGVIPAAIVLALACRSTYNEVPENRSLLALGLLSYSSPREVASTTGVSMEAWIGAKEVVISQRGSTPSYTTYRALIPNVVIAGTKGDLKVFFLNNRLEGTSFLPRDLEQFLRAARADVPGIDTQLEVFLEPHTRVHRQPYQAWVHWEDVRLTEELHELESP